MITYLANNDRLMSLHISYPNVFLTDHEYEKRIDTDKTTIFNQFVRKEMIQVLCR